MAACAHCGKKLGLLEYFRKRALKFCSKAHKKAYEHEQREKDRKQRNWHAFLAR